jgi:hypothetical protein
MSGIKVGVADLNDESKVLKTKMIESDLGKMKDVNGFGVRKNTSGKLTVYSFKGGVVSFYDVNY